MTDPEATPNEPAIDESAVPRPATPPAPPPRDREADAHYALPAAPRQDRPQARMPFLAAFFSLFPGLGNVYNGLYTRGFTTFLICIGLIGLATQARVEERAMLIFTVIFVWLFNIFDAYRQATLINYGYTPGTELPRPKVSTWGSGGLVAGLAIFAIGFYGFLREHFEIDLELLADYWYVLFMAFGVFLMWRPMASWIASARGRGEVEADEAQDELEDA